MDFQEIRAKLANSVGGEERFASSFNARTMFDTKKRAALHLNEGANTALETVARIRAAIEAAGLADHSRFDEAEWVSRFVGKWAAYQHAGARTLNWMVTGPASFPVRSNQKRMDTEHKRLGELVEFYQGAPAAEVKKAKRARAEAIGPAGIAQGELEDARKLLERREAAQAHMKAVNAIIRREKLGGGDGAKLAELATAAGFPMSPNRAGMILQPSFGRPGYARFQLSNNNAEIRRVKARVAELEAKAAAIAADPAPVEREIGGVRLLENVAIDRVQLVFPDKPSDEARRVLKGRGFRWSPREGAWQRQLTANGKRAAEAVIEQLAGAAA